MGNLKTLIVYYSRTGHAEAVVRDVARLTGADVEALDAGSFTRGSFWFLRAMWAAIVGGEPAIATPKHDPRDYDLVVLATPVWVGRPSPPMRVYLRDHAAELPAVAFVLTHGGGDASLTFEKLEALAGKAPVARVMVSEGERASGAAIDKISRFAALISPAPHADAA